MISDSDREVFFRLVGLYLLILKLDYRAAATAFDVSESSVRRWVRGESCPRRVVFDHAVRVMNEEFKKHRAWEPPIATDGFRLAARMIMEKHRAAFENLSDTAPEI